MELLDVRIAERNKIIILFRSANFCFYSSALNRSPTFYFAFGGRSALTTAKLCGRLRTFHNSGPLIDITRSSKGHIFFNRLDQRDELSDLMRLHCRARQQREARFVMDLAENFYRTTPQNGDYHFEYTKLAAVPDEISRRHASGGRVFVSARLTQAQIDLILARMLNEECAIKVDGAVTQALGVGVNRAAAVSGLAAYLASLG